MTETKMTWDKLIHDAAEAERHFTQRELEEAAEKWRKSPEGQEFLARIGKGVPSIPGQDRRAVS